MKRKGNIVCIVLIIIIVAVLSVFKLYEDKKSSIDNAQLEVLRKQYMAEKRAEDKEKAEKEAHFASIREDIPGIVCWGDDMTYGKGGYTKSYPNVLEDLMTDNGYQIPVYNYGVLGEDSLTVLGRMGAIPFVTGDFKIENDTDIYEIEIRSSYNGEAVNPLVKSRNPGINPCSIMGVDGTLYGMVVSKSLSKVDTFYFARSHTGNAVYVPDGTEIVVHGNSYKDYINILAVGENGGWESVESLVDQHKEFVNYLEGSKNADSYIILGMTKGNKEDNAEYDRLMEENFGEHYINVREYLATKAMSELNITPTDEDKAMMEKGQVPKSLMFDEKNINDNGYEAIGKAVYTRLAELNYIKK